MLEWEGPHQGSRRENKKNSKIGKPLIKMTKKKKKEISETNKGEYNYRFRQHFKHKWVLVLFQYIWKLQ